MTVFGIMIALALLLMDKNGEFRRSSQSRTLSKNFMFKLRPLNQNSVWLHGSKLGNAILCFYAHRRGRMEIEAPLSQCSSYFLNQGGDK